MLFEDAHWADQSSLELLDNVVGLLTDLPILLVTSFRTGVRSTLDWPRRRKPRKP